MPSLYALIAVPSVVSAQGIQPLLELTINIGVVPTGLGRRGLLGLPSLLPAGSRAKAFHRLLSQGGMDLSAGVKPCVLKNLYQSWLPLAT